MMDDDKQVSSNESVKLAELVEANFTTDFFRAAPQHFASEHGISLEQTPRYTACVVRDPTLAMYNSVLAFGVATPVTEADLDHLISLYSREGLSFSLPLSPLAQPPEIASWLEARGFRRENNSAKLILSYSNNKTPSVQGDFRIEEVEAGSQYVPRFVQIACGGLNVATVTWLAATLGREGWHHYLAFIEDRPVATGVLYVQNEVGQLGWAATLPEYRRRGAQTALLAHRIREAAGHGCKLLSGDTGADTVERPNSSYHNMLRLGFRLAYLRPKYVYEAATAANK